VGSSRLLRTASRADLIAELGADDRSEDGRRSACSDAVTASNLVVRESQFPRTKPSGLRGEQWIASRSRPEVQPRGAPSANTWPRPEPLRRERLEFVRSAGRAVGGRAAGPRHRQVAQTDSPRLCRFVRRASDPVLHRPRPGRDPILRIGRQLRRQVHRHPAAR